MGIIKEIMVRRSFHLYPFCIGSNDLYAYCILVIYIELVGHPDLPDKPVVLAAVFTHPEISVI